MVFGNHGWDIGREVEEKERVEKQKEEDRGNKLGEGEETKYFE